MAGIFDKRILLLGNGKVRDENNVLGWMWPLLFSFESTLPAGSYFPSARPRKFNNSRVLSM